MNKSFEFGNDVSSKMFLYYLVYVCVYNNSCGANMVVHDIHILISTQHWYKLWNCKVMTFPIVLDFHIGWRLHILSFILWMIKMSYIEHMHKTTISFHSPQVKPIEVKTQDYIIYKLIVVEFGTMVHSCNFW